MRQYLMQTPIGSIYLVVSDQALNGLYFRDPKLPEIEGESEILRLAIAQLNEYFDGKRQTFDLPMEFVKGTPFQRRVWDELAKIPFGQTISYRELAKRVENDRAVRAVGTANGRNPISIIIACHRVIAADGTLGGYGGGLERKAHLLRLERKH